MVGNYRITGVIGRGGMGTVYRAEHVYIERPAAIKVLHEQFAKEEAAVMRFLREARAASRVNHPNIVEVFDFGELPTLGVFLAMEFLEGENVAQRLHTRGPMPLFDTLNILGQIANALGQAHSHDIIHRDLKPENIMLVPRTGRREIVRAISEGHERRFVIEKERTFDLVKVLDFGIAKFHEPATAELRSAPFGVFGTPEYVSPEGARGEPVDARSDIYSVGIIFFEMLTGVLPFQGETSVDIMAKQVLSPPPSPRALRGDNEITPAAERLILRMLAKDPAKRPQSMDAVGEELVGCYGDVVFRRNANRLAGAKEAGIVLDAPPPLLRASGILDAAPPPRLASLRTTKTEPPVLDTSPSLSDSVDQEPILLTRPKQRA
jgi:serine/threonine-protein kinase